MIEFQIFGKLKTLCKKNKQH